MKIAVILRTMAFFYGSAIAIDPASRRLRESSLLMAITPCDESALLAALQQRDRDPDIKVVVVVMGTGAESLDVVKKGLVLGADEGVLIDDGGVQDATLGAALPPWVGGLASVDCEILLVGARKTDSNEDEFGVALGLCLERSVVSRVTDFDVTSGMQLLCRRKLAKGNREMVECDLPAVLTMEQSNIARYPTLRRIALSKDERVRTVSTSEAPRASIMKRAALVGLVAPKARPKKGLAEIDSSLPVHDRLASLLGGAKASASSDAGRELKGSPEKIADGMLEYLVAQGFLE